MTNWFMEPEIAYWSLLDPTKIQAQMVYGLAFQIFWPQQNARRQVREILQPLQ